MPSAEDNHVQMPNIEFKYIKQLQAENAELRVLLEEHQAAIEMIMTKYRQQVRYQRKEEEKLISLFHRLVSLLRQQNKKKD